MTTTSTKEQKTEKENAGGFATISVRNAANVEGLQPELLEKSDIGLMADNGMFDIVARGAARGKLVRAMWLDDWGTNGLRSRLAAQQFTWANRDDVSQNTPSLVAARLLVGQTSSFGHKVGQETRCLAGWDCSVAFYHAPVDEDIVVVPRKGLCPEGFGWELRRGMNCTQKASFAFGSVVIEELVVMSAVPFAEVVVAPMYFASKRIDLAMIVHGDDFFAEGRAEALLQADEHLQNKFQISLVSLAGSWHEKDVKILKRVSTHGTNGWAWTSNPAHSKTFVDELNLGGAKGAVTPGSKATAANDPPRDGGPREGCSITPWMIRVVRYIAGAPNVIGCFVGKEAARR